MQVTEINITMMRNRMNQRIRELEESSNRLIRLVSRKRHGAKTLAEIRIARKEILEAGRKVNRYHRTLLQAASLMARKEVA